MPASALPEGYELGPDNRSWLMRLKKKIQIIFAAGPRVPSGFWKWRETPKILFKRHADDPLRYENTDGSAVTAYPYEGFYLSRIQPWCRWGIVLQWPLFLNFWFFFNKDTPIGPLKYKSDFGITNLFTFHIGYKRDSDRTYWPTAFIGGNYE